MSRVCPLRLCRTEEDCPRAPCIDCMRRLGERMIEEVRIMQRQATMAQVKGDRPALDTLHAMLAGLGVAIARQEETNDVRETVHTG